MTTRTHTDFDYLAKTEGEFLQPSRWHLEAGWSPHFGDRKDDRRLTWSIFFLDAEGEEWKAHAEEDQWHAIISIGRNGRFDWRLEKDGEWEGHGGSISWRRAARAIWFAAHPEGLEKVRAERKRAAEARDALTKAQIDYILAEPRDPSVLSEYMGVTKVEAAKMIALAEAQSEGVEHPLAQPDGRAFRHRVS